MDHHRLFLHHHRLLTLLHQSIHDTSGQPTGKTARKAAATASVGRTHQGQGNQGTRKSFSNHVFRTSRCLLSISTTRLYAIIISCPEKLHTKILIGIRIWDLVAGSGFGVTRSAVSDWTNHRLLCFCSSIDQPQPSTRPQRESHAL